MKFSQWYWKTCRQDRLLVAKTIGRSGEYLRHLHLGFNGPTLDDAERLEQVIGVEAKSKNYG